jgi:hypothetical protein
MQLTCNYHQHPSKRQAKQTSLLWSWNPIEAIHYRLTWRQAGVGKLEDHIEELGVGIDQVGMEVVMTFC